MSGPPPKRLLFADDAELFRELVAAALIRQGFEVTTAVDGEDAITKFSEAPDAFYAVLLDISMPKANGLQAWASMDKLRSSVPVVFCSADLKTYETLLPSGPQVGRLSKPPTVEDLLDVLDAVQPRKAAQQNLEVLNDQSQPHGDSRC